MAVPTRAWDNYWGDEGSSRFRDVSWSKRRMLRVMAPHALAGQTVLDAGCGSGFFSRAFLDQGMDVISLDASEKALELTKTKTEGRGRGIQADLLQQDLALRVGQECGLVFSDGLFEHFEGKEQDRILLNLKKCLRADGKIITFVPNRFSPWELIRPFFMPGIEERPFTLKGLSDMHERNGFSVGQRGGVNVLPFPLSPEKVLGPLFGMLLFVIAKKR